MSQVEDIVTIPGVTRLTDSQRDKLMQQLEQDGYCELPEKLPDALVQECIAAIDRIAARVRAQAGPSPKLISVKVPNCVDADPVFRRLMMYEPALQLAYDSFGPMFHLNQSNCISRPRDEKTMADFVSASPWHADGPRPALFPKVGGAMGLHYLKFGYFFTDLTHGNGGPLQVVRGSHRRPELDGKAKAQFDTKDYEEDLITFNCKAGTVVAFHQAQWHAAPPNQSDVERKNAYISYCPTWMKPLDREMPRPGELPADITAEEAWLLGEHRSPMQFWLPKGDDATRMARFRRDSDRPVTSVTNYD
jgi:hypothetical protein